MTARTARLAALALLALAACSKGSPDPFAGFGPSPAMPPPHKSLIPVIGIPRVVGWPAGAAPQAPPGFRVTRLADHLDHPRWLYVLPNGDVLVAESASQPSKADLKGFRGWMTRLFMERAGAAAASPNRILLLRDADGDGRACSPRGCSGRSA